MELLLKQGSILLLIDYLCNIILGYYSSINVIKIPQLLKQLIVFM